MLDGHRPGDGEAWLELCAEWDVIGPSTRRRAAVARSRRCGTVSAAWPGYAGPVGSAWCARCSPRPSSSAERRFGGEAPRLLLAGNAGHADIPLDAPGSGLMALLMTMLGQTVGFPVPEGGAGGLAQALARRFAGLGGEIRTGTAVVAIEVDATAGRPRVRTARRDRYGARRAVVADVRPRRSTAACWTPATYPRATGPGDGALPAGPGHGQGRLGARRPGAVGRRPRRSRPGHRARRRLAWRR